MNRPLKDEVAHFAALAVQDLQRRAGGRLDFSESSLGVVEEILAEAATFAPDLPGETVRALVERVGSYILEVARREFGGEYLWHERAQPVLVVGEPQFHVAIVTWDRVRKRLSGDAANNIPFFYAGFSERARSAQSGTRAIYV